MPSYRYLAADLLTGTIREEIPFSEVRYSHILNRPGAFSATMPLRHPKATKANLDPGKTAIYVERDGTIMWGGILWTAQAQSESARLQVAGEGFWSYFRRRNIRATKTYTAQDQLLIARDLINYAQSQPGGNIGITVGSETCGVLRDRTYYYYERKNIAEAIEQLAAVQNGFDFAINVAWSGSSITKTFRPSYPERGVDTSLVFELGTNLEGLTQEIDATRQANLIDALGSGEGDTMLISAAADTSLLSSYPVLEDVVTYKDVAVIATLTAHAQAEVTARARPVQRIPTLLARSANPDSQLGSFITGDYVMVKGEDGYLSVEERMRIVSFDVQVDEAGRETVALGLEQSEVFS